MNYLIDTQILIWYQLESERLDSAIYDLLNNTTHRIYVSDISLFEIAIKQSLGKLPELDVTIEEIANLIIEDDFNLLTLKTKNIESYQHIPLYPEHHDPFDRQLLATAFKEKLPIISTNKNFVLYQ